MARQTALNRRNFVKASALTPLALSLAGGPLRAAEHRPAQPNILYIVADDLGYADLAVFGGHGANSPQIDRLAAEGMMLRQAYANSSVCTPSRVSIITGQYCGRFRVGLEEPLAPIFEDVGLPPGLPTLPQLLQNGGYRTSLVGKWHMGSAPKFGPLQSGYDRFFGIYDGAGDYFLNEGKAETFTIGQLYDGVQPVKRIGYLTDQLGDYAIQELDAAAQGDAPFFMSLHFTAPHWPWEGPGTADRAADMANIVDLTGGSQAIYAAMVKSLDDNVGRVLNQLDRLGLRDNTIVIFTSDNGGERFSDSWPLIGVKGELLEGGIRVPMLLRWPCQLRAGADCPQVISHMDLCPTLLAAAGLGPDPAFPSDGVDLLDVLTGREDVIPRKLFWRHKKYDQAAVRDGDWKYLRINGHEHLYNVVDDPRERAEKKDLRPELLQQLRGDWDAWNAQMLPYPPESYSTEVPGRAERY